MRFGALGDIHGDFAAARRIMQRHADVPCWVSVGDLADEHGRYEGLPSPLYWIKGNNENFDAIDAAAAAGDRVPSGARPLPDHANLLHIPNGTAIDLPLGEDTRVRVAGLGGTFAPTWYGSAAADLPHPRKGSAKATELADKRRHFVSEEVARCAAMRGVDLLLTHEAPRPFRVGRIEAGKPAVNEVLAAMRPRLHLFGHHHRFSEAVREGVRSVGLDLVSRSYLLVDAATLEYEHVSTGLE